MVFGRTPSSKEKIFINYRRSDAGGYAGRLSDTLVGYFGREQVFRDVTDIDYGHDFEKVIDEKIVESGAVIVLIGESWVDAVDSEGNRRLDDPEDYVTREIAAALARDVVVVPVLIGDANMPRPEELPAALAGFTKRNAITVTDERWDYDVTRLAKVLAIDVPGSVAQRRLDLLKTIALTLLLLANALTIYAFSTAAFAWHSVDLGLRDAGYAPIHGALPFIAILSSGTLVLMAAPLIERSTRAYAYAVAAVAAVGSLGCFLYYVLVNREQPDWSLVVTFGIGTFMSLAILVLMLLAGFKAK
jgi:hypothetical protein